MKNSVIELRITESPILGYFKWLMAVIFVFLFAMQTFAGDTGKITGTVRDGKGDPLPGANIIIEGTNMGAAADLNGHYTILYINPGVYTVRASMIGYQTVVEKNIEIHADRTIFLDFKLKEATVNMDEVVVTAKHHAVKIDVSSTQFSFNQSEAEALPVSSIQSVLSLQPGVSISGDNINVRGGGSDQVNVLLNGLSLKDNLFNRPYMALNMTDIAQIQVITSGFNAEYGNIRSGLVKVITKEGGSRFHIAVDYKILPYKQKYFGPNIFSPNYRTNIIYASPMSMDSAQLSRTYPYETTHYNFYGWPSQVKSLLSDADPSNDLTPKQAEELWKWQYRGLPQVKKPDQYLDGTISGPFPLALLPGSFGNLFNNTTFVLSHRYTDQMAPQPSIRNYYYNRNTQLQITNKDIQGLKVVLTGLWGYEYGIGSANYNSNLDVSQYGSNPYSNATDTQADLYTTLFGVKATHFLSKDTYYEVQLSYMKRQYYLNHGPLRDSTNIYTIPADWYVLPNSLSVKGYWDYQTGQYINQPKTFTAGDSLWVPARQENESPWGWIEPGPAYVSIDGRTNLDASIGAQDFSYEKQWNLKFDLASQINHENLVKTGLSFNYDGFHRRFYNIHYGNDGQKIFYDDYPMVGAFYVQDQYERKGLIANVGVRVDYYNSNAQTLSPDNIFSPYFGQDYNFYSVLDSIPKGPSNKYILVSPRIGVSFPTSVSSKIYFNYGHFYSSAPSQYVYGYVNSNSGNLDIKGNPNLKPPETISYEVGYEQAVSQEYLLHLALYYKDVANQIGALSVVNGDGSVSYVTYQNSNFESIIGLDLRISKSFGDFFTGWIQTEFFGSSSGFLGFQTLFPAGSSIQSQFYTPVNPAKFLWNWTPSFLANINIHTPMDWGPKILGSNLLGGWNLNLIQSWSEGAPFTWNPQNDPTIIDNLRMVNNYRTDIKIGKRVEFSSDIAATFYLDVRNLFPRKVFNPGALYGPSNDPDSEQYKYYNSLIPGQDKVGDYKSAHIQYPRSTPGYTLFYDPNGIQQIYFGMRLEM